MNKYELAMVVSAKLDDEARTAVVDRAKSYVERYGGQLGETEEWGKRRLAYEIQKMNEGYYYFVQFEAEPDCPGELEKHMRIMDNVLRYLVVRKDENDTFTVTPEKSAEEEEEEVSDVEAAEEAVVEEAAEEAAEEEAPAQEEAAEEVPAEETAEEENE